MHISVANVALTWVGAQSAPLSNGVFFGDCLTNYSLVQMGFVVGGGGGSGAPWLPIGGAVRVLATHTRLAPTHQSPTTSSPPPPELLRPKHKAPRSFEWAAFI